MLQKFIVSRDDSIYQAWPDVALTGSGRLVCVFSECTHHHNRDYTRIMYCTSADRGRKWAPKRPLTEPLRGNPKENPFWNCPRIVALGDGRLAVIVDRGPSEDQRFPVSRRENLLFFSADDGETWSAEQITPARGIVPDRLIELKRGRWAGRWIISCHAKAPSESEKKTWEQRCWISDDRGATWSGPHIIASSADVLLCEGSVVHLPGDELVCFMRENSWQGLDCYKSISRDGGTTWEGPHRFPLPACHRPVGGMLQSGRVLVTFRMMQGGKGGLGWWTQNFMAGLTEVDSCLATDRWQMRTRIMPIDYDRSPVSDGGYSGWVQFSDGEIYMVNYIVDDAPKAHIRGYALTEEEMVL